MKNKREIDSFIWKKIYKIAMKLGEDLYNEEWSPSPLLISNGSLTTQKRCVCCALCTIIALLIAIFVMTVANVMALGYGAHVAQNYEGLADNVRKTTKEVRTTTKEARSALKNFTKLREDVPVFVEIAEMIVKNKDQIMDLLPFISKGEQCIRNYGICPGI